MQVSEEFPISNIAIHSLKAFSWMKNIFLPSIYERNITYSRFFAEALSSLNRSDLAFIKLLHIIELINVHHLSYVTTFQKWTVQEHLTQEDQFASIIQVMNRKFGFHIEKKLPHFNNLKKKCGSPLLTRSSNDPYYIFWGADCSFVIFALK